MPNTIRKMTGGVADITIFGEAKLRNGQPDQESPFGIEKVYINGVNVLDGNHLDSEAIRYT